MRLTRERSLHGEHASSLPYAVHHAAVHMAEQVDMVQCSMSTIGVEAKRGSAAVLATLQLLRPKHWVKNLFVFAPALFSRQTSSDAWYSATITCIALCLASSFAYAINDVCDIAADRLHPHKRMRPVASGIVTPRAALMLAAILASSALCIEMAGSPAAAWCVIAYLILSVLYSLWLKHIVLIDIFCIAAFFLLRLEAGAAAVSAPPSRWLFLCGGLLALYLAVSKRQHELASVADRQSRRAVLHEYSPQLLSQIAVALIAATFLAYCQYIMMSDTSRQPGGSVLAYGTPCVLYGLLRYQLLVHQRGAGDPIETLFTDRSLQVTLMIWVMVDSWALYRG